DLGVEGNTFLIMGGEKKIFSLSYNITGPGIIPPLGDQALIRLERTINYWREWIQTCSYRGEYSQEVRRSALALKLLTYSPSGAIIAAPTTSLPEKIKGERNWDYRFCWLRDAAFTVRAFLGLGLIEEARAYMSWILHSTELTRPRLQVMYTLYGYSKISEKILNWFSGYKDSRPVRSGNGASTQFQLDVYGEVMDAVYLFSPHVKKFDKDNFQFLKGIADSVCDLWQIPDEGIWEIRSGPLHHVHSQAMALIALDRFLKLADHMSWKIPRGKYETTAKQIKERIENEGYSEALQSYVRASDDNAGLDASLLTIPILGEGLLNDKRMRRTIRAVQRDLMENGLTYRYKNREDGLPGTEGAFGACSFWMVEDLARIGQQEEARELMDTLLEKQNDVGLWPEELDPENDEYLGNYPQAFTHTALIGAALTLQEKFS
ncbi:MAG: glycoside hydrolase family 15 protein, partial [Bacteriovoracaceae bacterium]